METSGRQLSVFDINEQNSNKKNECKEKYSVIELVRNEAVVSRLDGYSHEEYISDVESYGLEEVWNCLCQYVTEEKNNSNGFINIDSFCELYEIGLAIQDKKMKKESGQYCTPDDIATIMCQWLNRCEGTNVCDVACGTGKLILTYLDLLGYEQARKLISEGRVYLYDSDRVALKICCTIIAVKYGFDIAPAVNDIVCDFLDSDITLPDNCKVISNPPYAHIDNIQDCWLYTDVLVDTKDFYSAFMEKVFLQAKSTVIITPFSFISGAKFLSLRKMMCSIGNGFVISFDNVPGSVFYGRKHGVFNSNTANSVRAAITVEKKNEEQKGFRVSPLIRFKNAERAAVIKCDTLEALLPDEHQVVDKHNKCFKKIDKKLTEIYKIWTGKSEFTVKSFVSECETEYSIDMPSTCRYYTTASSRFLNRAGLIKLYVDSKDKFNFLYCLINSSFAYWWWRIYDGGITYPLRLLNDLPLPYNLLTEEDRVFFENVSENMVLCEDDYVVTKMNAGVLQENIKFPEEFRTLINSRLLKILGCSEDGTIFDCVHTNRFSVR